MKKLVLITTGILLFLSSFTAAAVAKTPDMILPEGTNLYMKADPSNINETFAGYYEEMMDSFTVSMFYKSYYYEEEPTAQYTETSDNLKEIFSTNALYLAFEADYDIDGYLEPTMITFLFEISENDYEDNVLAPYIAENSIITEVEGVSVYEPEDIDGAIAYYEGYLLFADETESIETLITAEGKLSANSEFQDISEKFLSDNFFELYVGDIQIFLDEFYGYDEFYETLVTFSALESVGFSMAESSTGYEFQSFVNQDSETLAELNIDYDNMDPLTLHNFMPSKNPIFYSAKNNNADLISMIKNNYEYEYIADELAEELHLDLDELVFALENETAFLIQDSGELFPTATLMTKLGDNKEDIQTQVDQFVENTWDTILDESDVSEDGTATFYENDSTVTMTKSNIDIDGATLDQFVLKIKPDVRKNPYALILDPSLLEYKITIGITSDDVLLISSNKNIEDDYNDGLENNEDMENLFGSTDAISYLSITQVNDYIQSALTTVEEYLPEDFNELEETKSVINTLLEPWGVFKGTDSITNDYIDSEATLVADIEKIIANYNIEKLEDDFDASSRESGSELIFNSPKDFSDVETDMWYGDNVYYLTSKGIVDGNPDGTYKPSDTLNRAEFIKLLAETLEKEGLIDSIPYYGSSPYLDIPTYEWYAGHVEVLHDEGLFDGLWDGLNLNANTDMTRIETAQLLNNVLNTYSVSALEHIQDEMLLSDIDDEDLETVENVYRNRVMLGTSSTEFSPNKTLNRAEAASVIRNLLQYVLQDRDSEYPY